MTPAPRIPEWLDLVRGPTPSLQCRGNHAVVLNQQGCKVPPRVHSILPKLPIPIPFGQGTWAQESTTGYDAEASAEFTN
jgi:hypothetical protein